MNHFKFILLVFTIVAVYSCAVQKSPLGGPKDEDPPKIDSLKSTPNFQTNFTEKEVRIYFDEFVQLKNVFEQVVYSPPLGTKPELIQRGKKIRLKFAEDDTLKTNTTYTINFGDAIQDFNESNILENFRFVFSTGDIIDSLEISGSVLDDDTQIPAEEVLVLLYDNLEDSIVYKEQPYYFAKTDEVGQFSIQNLRSDTFKVIVLKDGNLNLKYDEGESVGFLDSNIIITDSLPGRLALNIFTPEEALNLVDYEIYPNKISFEFNRPPYDLEIKNSSDSVWWRSESLLDSMLLWHDHTVSSDSFFLFANEEVVDTFLFKRKGSPVVSDGGLPSKKDNLSRRDGLKTGEQLKFEFVFPIVGIDSSQFSLKDSVERTNFDISIDSLNSRFLEVAYDYKYGDTLNLTILPGGLNFINGDKNDTISQAIIPENPEKYGLIILTIDSLSLSEQYVFQLLDGEKIVKEEIIKNKSSEIFRYINMEPKEYVVKLIQDLNRNGKWDPGSYELKSKSEIWQIFSIEALRENWELEANVKWKE